MFTQLLTRYDYDLEKHQYQKPQGKTDATSSEYNLRFLIKETCFKAGVL